MMRKELSLTCLALLVSLVVGCETSTQNYAHSGQVVDLKRTQSSEPTYQQSRPNVRPSAPAASIEGDSSYIQQQQAQAQRPPVNHNVQQVSEEIMVTETPAYSNVSTGSSVGSAGVNQSSSMTNSSYNTQTTIVYGQDPLAEDLQSLPVQQPKPVQPVLPQQEENLSQASSSSGNWLLVDSAAAKQDESNTAKEQAQLQAQDSSAAVMYQNKTTTTAGPDQYRVLPGDTLYSIAFRYGLDYHSLAKLNRIEPPYNLAVGQVLRLNLKASQAPVYIVKTGDTLYSIAKQYGQSVSFLAGVNDLEPPYNLTLGQKILLSRDTSLSASEQKAVNTNTNMEVPVAGKQEGMVGSSSTTANANSSKDSSKITASTAVGGTTKPSSSAQEPAKVPPVAQTPIVNSKTRKVAGVTWSWPTSGRVIEQFSTAEQGNKGVDISGPRGQAIFAAADGQVVYSGNALRGFGNLIIINHTNEYLSAYAHNDALLVKEGQKVKRGQQIARMGSTDAASSRLHFEIRYRGQSVNPVSYLPK